MILRLLPYALLLGGLFFLAGSLPTAISGGESTYTPASIADVTTTVPPQRWLKLTGGGLYLPGAFVEERTRKSTGKTSTRAWFVPLITEAEAKQRAAALVAGTPPPPPAKLVVIRFDPRDFQLRYPRPDDPSPEDVFKPAEIIGTRASNLLFPPRMENFIKNELKMPLESVVVIKNGDRPLQRDDAISMATFFGACAAAGLLWIIFRWRPRKTLPPPPLPTHPPTP